MKEKNYSIIFLVIIFLNALAFVMVPTLCKAQDWSRKWKSELFAIVQSMNGDSSTGLGITLELDDTVVGGFGVGYNFNDHMNINAKFFFGSTDITASGNGSPIRGDSTVSGWDVNLDVNILENRFTPIVTGGIGFIQFRGDYGISGSDFEETDFSYNVGGGFRWNATDHFLMKAIYKAMWTEIENVEDAFLLDGINLSIGYVF